MTYNFKLFSNPEFGHLPPYGWRHKLSNFFARGLRPPRTPHESHFTKQIKNIMKDILIKGVVHWYKHQEKDKIDKMWIKGKNKINNQDI